VATVERVDSADDPRLTDYVDLTDVALRSAREPAEGLFLAEGEKVIRRALDAGYRPRSVLLEEKWWPGLEAALAAHDCPVYLADATTVSAVTGYRVHRGALASIHRREPTPLATLVDGATRLVVLEDLVDHTNVGAVFRNAAALGFDGIVLSPGCADPLYRRSIKVSMGAALTLPWSRSTTWPDPLDDLAADGWQLLATSPDPAGTDLRTLVPADRVAVVLGTEGDGLSAAALERSQLRVRIPMAAGVDSLNVAAASAVVLYAVGPGRAGTAGSPGPTA
jgi:tRNA G18 (ribose-2'-O)-methylase SpoU